MLFSMFSQLFCSFFHLILHVSTPGSFPRPLTKAEEEDCLKRMHQGDESAREKLINHNLRLVAHIIKKYYSAQDLQEDLISIGTIGLIKAISSFNSTKGTRLATYAARCIDNEILMYFRNQKKTAQDVSINEPIDTDKDGNALTLIDVIADDTDIIEDIDTKLKVQRMKKYIRESLSPREQQILIYRYGLGGTKELTQREVAKKLGISRSYVSRIEKKAFSILRKQFDN